MRVLKEGKIILGLTTVINVKVRDLNASGARLMLPGHTQLPPVFRLSVGLSLNPRPVRLCWQSANQVGVAYADVEGSEAPPPLEGDSEEIPEPDKEPFLPVAREGEGEAHLALEYRLRRAPSAERPGTGHCVIDLRVRSKGKIDAEQPFLALPQLGPEVVAAERWNAREIVALRKMVRVARVDDRPLQPDSVTPCCSLHLPFTQEGGGFVVYARGIEHAVAGMPDFKISCQVGAANFPVERMTLHVPAADIARMVR